MWIVGVSSEQKISSGILLVNIDMMKNLREKYYIKL